MIAIKVKGTSFRQPKVKALPTRCLGILSLQPENVHDKEACAITVDGEIVGFLPRGWARRWWGPSIVKVIKDQEGVVPLKKVGRSLFGLRLGLDI